MNAGPALELENVVKSFGPVTAVDGISLTAERGEVFALLGPNGAGKTTTIEMCEGFKRPTSGRIRVLGLDPVTRPEVRTGSASCCRRRPYTGIRVGEMLHGGLLRR